MKKTILFLLICLLMTQVQAASPKVGFVKGDNRIDVVIAGKPFTSYLYDEELHLIFEKGETAHFRFLVIVQEGLKTHEQIEGSFKEFASVKGD